MSELTIEELLSNRDKILSIKSRVDSHDPSMFDHFVVNNCDITPETITIVMTASNRSKQTYFTLQSMLKSKCKNLQIILVDDSTDDPVSLNILKNYPYYIDLIVVNRATKNWVNPCVNYNIGFQFIQGRIVVIQNAEVCYIGDPLRHIRDNIKDDEYFVFDVISSIGYDSNEEIYKSDLTDILICNEPFFSSWYQHSVHNNRNLHFFTSMTRKTFTKINEFSYDYSIAMDFDDDDFVLKISSRNINIINVTVDIYHICGIHLYHGMSHNTWGKGIKTNESVYNFKKDEFAKNAGHEVVGVQGFAGEISEAQRMESRKSNDKTQTYIEFI